MHNLDTVTIELYFGSNHINNLEKLSAFKNCLWLDAMSNDALKPKMMYYFKIKLSSHIRRAYRTLHLNEVLNKNPKHLHIYLDGGHRVMSCESSAILFYRKYTLVRISYCSRVEYFLEIMNEFLAMSVTIVRHPLNPIIYGSSIINCVWYCI